MVYIYKVHIFVYDLELAAGRYKKTNLSNICFFFNTTQFLSSVAFMYPIKTNGYHSPSLEVIRKLFVLQHLSKQQCLRNNLLEDENESAFN